jgi:cytochrome c553
VRAMPCRRSEGIPAKHPRTSGREGHDPDAPNCMSCHGRSAPDSDCERGDFAGSQERICPTLAPRATATRSFSRGTRFHSRIPWNSIKQSVHGRAIAGWRRRGRDLFGLSWQPRHSALARSAFQGEPLEYSGNLRQCHKDISKTYLDSVHGQAMKEGVSGAPVCSDCHGEHLILGRKSRDRW